MVSAKDFNRLNKYYKISWEQAERDYQKAQTALPKIIIQPSLTSDPCINEMDQKTNDTSGMMKIILIGVIIGVILGVIK